MLTNLDEYVVLNLAEESTDKHLDCLKVTFLHQEFDVLV